MKYLSDYLKEGQDKLFEECKCFFAFNNEQLEEGMAKFPDVKKWIRITNVGMFISKEHADDFLKRHAKLVEDCIALDVKENGKKGVIHRELGNHEYSYTGSIQSTVEALADYPITREEIQAEIKPYMQAYREWEAKQEAVC